MASDDHEERVERVIAEFLAAEDAGTPLDRDAVLAQHPDLADELRTFFRDHDRIGRMAAPLREAGPDETVDSDTMADPELPRGTRVVYFGDYELVRELGRGGMGIVYRARQISLNRLVALKMLKSDVLASDDERRRFRNEAEAVAVLDHPHIVPILEVGEHEGHRYFTMKLVEGPSLDHTLGEYTSDPKAAARLVATATEAVHHAHQRGILHRDLKPSNILLDERGEPYITDFGLAKRVKADSELTHSGAILGTPAYMAPEQASGHRGVVTTASDVYGLGAVLYALLTGKAPFSGDSVVDTLEQVRERAPEPPSKLNQATPRDLEVICLKCLEKDPARRYGTAQDLAADLRRWLAAEPIAARPVGRLERGWLWARRNPVVAGLIASVALALILGAVVSSVFAVQAVNAERSLERAFARSLAKPLNPDADDATSISEPERESLWQLAGYDGESLRLRFLDAADDPLVLRQLRARSEPAAVAALGLDPERRAKASQMLVERLRDPALPLESKVELAFLLLEIEDRHRVATEQAADVLIQAFWGPVSQQLRSRWEKRLKEVAKQIEPNAAGQVMLAVMEHVADADGLTGWAEALASLATRLEPPGAAKLFSPAADQLAAALERGANSDARVELADGLASLVSRLSPSEAAKLCSPAAKQLAAALEGENGPPDISGRKEGLLGSLLAVAANLDPGDAVATARKLAASLGHNTDAYARRRVAVAVSGVVWGRDAAEAERVCAPAAKTLADALEHETNAGNRQRLAEALSSTVSRLDATEAARVCRKSMRILLAAREATFRKGEALPEYDSLDGILTYVEPGIGHVIARELTRAYCAWRRRHLCPIFGGLDDTSDYLISIMSDTSPARKPEWTVRMALAMATAPGPGGALLAATIAAEPYPCRLTTQELVELLKMPTCCGEYSSAVLDQLGNIHGRRFASRGEFIRFARDTGLDLDLTTPPKRPDPREPLERLLEPPAAVVKP